ncbi:MAG: hypothetical protein IPN79_04420 [Saprospiraceae bacterium]|nr:hypothetical protein [Saprospiraceae bacterium]
MRLLIFLLIPFYSLGQSPSLELDENGKYHFQKVIETSLTVEENYKKAKETIAYLYENANWVIKSDNKEKVIVKGLFVLPVHSLFIGDLHHTLTIDIKDGKVRLTFNQLAISGYGIEESTLEELKVKYNKKFYDKVKSKTQDKMILFCNNFQNNMAKKNDDW